LNTFISMLRGINVGGSKKVKMNDLIALYESLGFVNVRTYVQSGNLIFDFPGKDVSKLQKMIETGIQKTFGFSADVLIRTVDEFRQITLRNPFLKRKDIDISKLHVTFLSSIPTIKSLDALKNMKREDADEFITKGKEIYLFCPNGYGRTKLSNNFFEKKLGITATTRNWRSVVSLLEIAGKRL